MYSLGRLVAKSLMIGLMSIVIVFVGVSYAKQAKANEIAWQSYSSNVFTKATQEKKRVLVYAFATWCHYCQHMQAATLSNKEVISAIQANFIPVKVDVDKDADATEHFHVDSYPTIIILDSSGQVVDRYTGFMEPSQLLSKLK